MLNPFQISPMFVTVYGLHGNRFVLFYGQYTYPILIHSPKVFGSSVTDAVLRDLQIVVIFR
jgi:hypothetical protein